MSSFPFSPGGLPQLAPAPPLSTLPLAGPPPESKEDQKHRFQVECEFVQALANPHYLNFLAQRGYFKADYFINYLKYLLYWKRPEYARALKYPQCLFFLDLLQEAEFREAMASTANAKFCEEQQMLQWQFYIRKRVRLQTYPAVESEHAGNGNGAAASAMVTFNLT